MSHREEELDYGVLASKLCRLKITAECLRLLFIQLLAGFFVSDDPALAFELHRVGSGFSSTCNPSLRLQSNPNGNEKESYSCDLQRSSI